MAPVREGCSRGLLQLLWSTGVLLDLPGKKKGGWGESATVVRGDENREGGAYR
jgi:hypothetical protein